MMYLQCRQNLHSKLPQLLDLTPTMGDFWYHLDMTAEHHAATARHWLMCAPLSFCQGAAACSQAGSRTMRDRVADPGWWCDGGERYRESPLSPLLSAMSVPTW